MRRRRIRRITGSVLRDRSIESGFGAEVQEKPDFEIRCTQVIEELTSRNLGKLHHRLDFNYDFLVDDLIEAVQTSLFSFVVNVHRNFTTNSVPSAGQLPLERVHINAFEKPEAEGVVHLVKSTDD